MICLTDSDFDTISADFAEREKRVTAAADYLDATRLADGRYVYYDDATLAWWAVSAADLAELPAYLERHDGYSLWCASTSAEEMPEGWAPSAD